MAKKVLDGIKIKDIPVLYDSPNAYIFDYKQIKKFDIEESLLPKDSNFINKKLSVFEIYFKEIIAIIVIFLFMIIYIITLLINIKKRKELELENQKNHYFINKFIEDANAIVSIINNERKNDKTKQIWKRV